MVIRNISKQYRVIREWGGPGEITQYICREEEEERDCRIAVQDLERVTNNEVRFLMEQVNNQRFRDFIDFFTDAKNLYVVTAYSGEESLEKKLQENCSFRERMEIGKNLLEYILLSDVPDYFFQASMGMETITVSRSLEIGLCYDLSYLDEFESASFQKGAFKLGRVLWEIYREELSVRAFGPMEGLIYDLENSAFSTVLEVYERFQEIYREWAEKKKEQMEPESFPFRVWKLIKRAGKLLKTAAAVGILALAMIYLGLSIREFLMEPGQADNYSAIGTLKIQSREDGAAREMVRPEDTDVPQ